jgi:hypothetical protein
MNVTTQTTRLLSIDLAKQELSLLSNVDSKYRETISYLKKRMHEISPDLN